jgi:hypothetical protein
MPSDIKNFQEVQWNCFKKGDKAWIPGNLDADGNPTRVYGPHTVIDPKNHILKSCNNGKLFPERWGWLYVPKKKVKTIRMIVDVTLTYNVNAGISDEELLNNIDIDVDHANYDVRVSGLDIDDKFELE